MFTLWPSALFTALSLLHLIPVINFLMGFFPTVILTLVSECLSKIKLSSYTCACLWQSFRESFQCGIHPGRGWALFASPDLEMLSNAGNQILRGIAFSAFSALSILFGYEWIYNFGGQMSAILFHESLFSILYESLFCPTFTSFCLIQMWNSHNIYAPESFFFFFLNAWES